MLYYCRDNSVLRSQLDLSLTVIIGLFDIIDSGLHASSLLEGKPLFILRLQCTILNFIMGTT